MAYGAIGALILAAAAAPAVAGGYYDIGGPPPGYGAAPCPPPPPPPCPCRQRFGPPPAPEWGEAPPPGWGGPPPPEDEGFAPADVYEGSEGYVGGGYVGGGYGGSGEVIEGGPGFGIGFYGGYGGFDHGRRFYGEREHMNQRVWRYGAERASEHAQGSVRVSEQAHVQARSYVHVGGGWRGGGWGRR